MPKQNYRNHKQFAPLYHFFSMPLALIVFITALVYTISSLGKDGQVMVPVLISIMALNSILGLYFARGFALKTQDRAIRAEENFRYYVLTGSRLDPRLSLRQIIALRFASDGELPALCERVLAENLSADAIKRAVQDWQADGDRL